MNIVDCVNNDHDYYAKLSDNIDANVNNNNFNDNVNTNILTETINTNEI